MTAILMISLSTPNTNYIRWQDIKPIAIKECKLYPHPLINYKMVRAIMFEESRVVTSKIEIFNQYAKSYDNCRGLMQVKPSTLEWVNLRLKTYKKKTFKLNDLYDVKINIHIGVWVFSYYLTEEDFNIKKALQRYSGNADNYAERVLKRYKVYGGEL